MAIYHADVKTFSRAKGHSAVGAAAYRAALHLLDIKGERHDYRRRRGVEKTICVAPQGSPEWAEKPEELWIKASVAEKRCDATLCREFLTALPHQFDASQRLALVEDICGELVERYRFAVQASIHSPRTPDGLNWHVHILATTRRMTAEGLGEKTRELDGGPSGRAEVNWARAMIAERTNEHLAKAGIAIRVDHRTLIEQSLAAEARGDFASAMMLAREPTKHLGKDAIARVRKSLPSERSSENDAIRHTNDSDIQARLAAIEKEGRLMRTPTAHSQEAARREREEAKQAARVALPAERLLAAGLIHPRIRRTRSTPALADTIRPSLQRVGPGSGSRDRDIERLMFEALRRWLEGLEETMRQSAAAAEVLLSQQEDLLRRCGHRVRFRRDCSDLAGAVERSARDQLRWPRSLEAADRAQMELGQARLELGQLDAEGARTSLWFKREWAQRRRAHERRVVERKQARDQARAATGPEAQVRYNRIVDRSVAEVEKIAVRMVKVYAIEPMVPTQPEVADVSDESSEQKPTKRKRIGHLCRTTLR